MHIPDLRAIEELHIGNHHPVRTRGPIVVLLISVGWVRLIHPSLYSLTIYSLIATCYICRHCIRNPSARAAELATLHCPVRKKAVNMCGASDAARKPIPRILRSLRTSQGEKLEQATGSPRKPKLK